MFQFFEQIGQFLGSIVDFVVNFFTNLVNFFKMIFSALSFLVEICAALPVPVQAACIAIISMSVIFLIVGR